MIWCDLLALLFVPLLDCHTKLATGLAVANSDRCKPHRPQNRPRPAESQHRLNSALIHRPEVGSMLGAAEGG
jgi:hypothetical protein